MRLLSRHCAFAAACICALAPIAAPGASDTPTTQIEIAAATPATELAAVTPATGTSVSSLLTLGIADAVSVQVYGRPELSTTTYVSDDGTIPIPLAGNVPVAGVSPAKAGERIANAFRKGGFLVDPQVTLTLVQFRGQQVSVLGAVRTPGRFAVESRTTVLDVLAQAGGATDNGADVVVLLRPDKDGKIARTTIDLKGLNQTGTPLPRLTVRGGDSIFVPVAEQFYINGEVRTPAMYRLDPGMTVTQAIARSGGLTRSGSNKRIEIKRRKPDGTYATRTGTLDDAVQANDVIRVKESIF